MLEAIGSGTIKKVEKCSISCCPIQNNHRVTIYGLYILLEQTLLSDEFQISGLTRTFTGGGNHYEKTALTSI